MLLQKIEFSSDQYLLLFPIHCLPSKQPLNNRLSHVEDYCDNDDEQELRPVMGQPDWSIRGGPSIKQYTILNDKRHLLTRDTEENVVLWDILKVGVALVFFMCFVCRHFYVMLQLLYLFGLSF